MRRSEQTPPVAIPIDQLPFSRAFAYQQSRAGNLILRKLGGRTVVLRSDLEDFLQKLPVKTGVSQAHREKAKRRWLGKVSSTNE
jgi:hypothetical protein